MALLQFINKVGEDLEQGHDVLLGEVTGFAAHQAADKAAREATVPGDIALAEVALFCLALECDAEIAHLSQSCVLSLES